MIHEEGLMTTAAIITIGPKTDAAIDQFGLLDSLIPRLHNMTRTIRSSRWQRALQGPEWGLSHEQALSLSRALLHDIGAEIPMVSIKLKSTLFSVLTADAKPRVPNMLQVIIKIFFQYLFVAIVSGLAVFYTLASL